MVRANVLLCLHPVQPLRRASKLLILLERCGRRNTEEEQENKKVRGGVDCTLHLQLNEREKVVCFASLLKHWEKCDANKADMI